ncbi:hypothetical protein ACIP93_33190 [Streptomyces sp. NPDC088745]|uniref:hypothetical protein n=1 Tax=Streptomyces sp. NPDC088745 TaxID=3365884 RepID=UPI0038067405
MSERITVDPGVVEATLREWLEFFEYDSALHDDEEDGGDRYPTASAFFSWLKDGVERSA